MATKTVVAGTDGSEESLRAVEWAAREAVLRGAPLRIVSAAELLPRMVARQSGPDIDTVADVIRKNRDQALAVAAERAATIAPGLLVDTDELPGPIAQAVADSGSGASMLVVGSRGIGAFAAMILGSVSRYAATHASCPVVVVRDETTASERRQVGVGIGDLEDCAAALTFAFEEAALRDASLIAIHAFHSPQGSHDAQAQTAALLEELLASWRGKYPGVPVSHDVVHGHPGRALAGLSARADLVVLGRHPAHPERLAGSGRVTHAVLNHAHGPVATVPAS